MAGPVLTFLSNTEIAAACARAIIVRSMTAGSDVPVASVVSVDGTYGLTHQSP